MTRAPDHSEDAHTGRTPPFMRPVLHALDRMQRHEVPAPGELTAHVRQLLAERFGAQQAPLAAAFAHGGTGLLGEQTHYADGFAVLLPLAQGTAVAARRTDRPASRVVFQADEGPRAFDAHTRRADDRPVWVQVVLETARRLAPPGTEVDVAVASTVPAACLDAYLAALGVAAARAMRQLGADAAPAEASDAGSADAAQGERVLPEMELPEADLLEAVRERLAACTGLPFSIAYLIAAAVGETGTYLLADTATREHLALAAPPSDVLGWGLVDVHPGPPREASFHQERRAMAEEALAQLRAAGFEIDAGFRDLEHRDLERALDAVADPLRPVVRHLVAENRRVQRLAAAVRRTDWQMAGALLLMSHASLRDLWGSTTGELDFVVQQAETLSMDGVYGACMTGRGGCALVMGRPFAVPRALDQIAASFEQRFGYAPETMLL